MTGAFCNPEILDVEICMQYIKFNKSYNNQVNLSNWISDLQWFHINGTPLLMSKVDFWLNPIQPNYPLWRQHSFLPLLFFAIVNSSSTFPFYCCFSPRVPFVFSWFFSFPLSFSVVPRHSLREWEITLGENNFPISAAVWLISQHSRWGGKKGTLHAERSSSSPHQFWEGADLHDALKDRWKVPLWTWWQTFWCIHVGCT